MSSETRYWINVLLTLALGLAVGFACTAQSRGYKAGVEAGYQRWLWDDAGSKRADRWSRCENVPAIVECRPTKILDADKRSIPVCRWPGEDWSSDWGVIDTSGSAFLFLYEWDPIEQNWDRARTPELP